MKTETVQRLLDVGMGVAIATISIFLLSGCAGNAARDNLLSPAIQLAWPGVMDDVQRGIDDAAEDGDISAAQETNLELDLGVFAGAVDSGDRDQLAAEAPQWPTFRGYGDRGVQDRIDDEEISSGVAASLIERLDNFTESLNAMGS